MSVSTAASPLHRGHVQQRSSHACLARVEVAARARSTRSGRFDAIVVPASRGAAALDGAVHLASRVRAPLVVLCSQQTARDDVVARFARTRARLLVVDVPAGYRHDLLPTRTGAERFRRASGDRTSDLSVKRNLGLLLARLLGWGKVLFLDDDIGDAVRGHPTGLPVDTMRRLAAALDTHQVAGLTCRDFPDNSVVCHARRLAGLAQDTFISGAALGVNCHDHPLPFFPDQYNEDWFFFSRRVAARDIADVGDATQAPYDPFENPDRARQEEFGDLLAEGLFALFEEQSAEMDYRRRLEAADRRYWEQFITARWHAMTLIGMELEIAAERRDANGGRLMAALRSLDAAAAQLARLSPDLCVDYLDAWNDDLLGWERATQRIPGVPDTAEAMDFLGLPRSGERRDRTTRTGRLGPTWT